MSDIIIRVTLVGDIIIASSPAETQTAVQAFQESFEEKKS